MQLWNSAKNLRNSAKNIRNSAKNIRNSAKDLRNNTKNLRNSYHSYRFIAEVVSDLIEVSRHPVKGKHIRYAVRTVSFMCAYAYVCMYKCTRCHVYMLHMHVRTCMNAYMTGMLAAFVRLLEHLYVHMHIYMNRYIFLRQPLCSPMSLMKLRDVHGHGHGYGHDHGHGIFILATLPEGI